MRKGKRICFSLTCDWTAEENAQDEQEKQLGIAAVYCLLWLQGICNGGNG